MNKSINSIDNYKQTLKESNEIVLEKYLDIVDEYITFAISNIHIQKNNYFKYIIIKGIETIQYVFIMLLLYTKNLDLVYHHCCKAFYYYIEFIGQVGDDNHVFLRLTSTDAILFVYKKTIFEVNESFKRTFESPVDNEKEKFDNITSTIELFNVIMFNTYDKCDNINSAERNNLYLDYSISLLKSYKKIINTDDGLNSNTVKNIQCFNNILTAKTNSIDIYVNNINLFIKKIIKKNISSIEEIKYSHIDFEDSENISKFIHSLFD